MRGQQKVGPLRIQPLAALVFLKRLRRITWPLNSGLCVSFCYEVSILVGEINDRLPAHMCAGNEMARGLFYVAISSAFWSC